MCDSREIELSLNIKIANLVMGSGNMQKLMFKRLYFLFLGVIAFIITKYAEYNTLWSENIYAKKIYPFFKKVFGFFPAQFNFSVAEISVVIFIIFSITYIIYLSLKIKRNRGNRVFVLYTTLVNIAILTSTIYFVFTIFCGLNYYRYTFTEYTGYEIEAYEVEELELLCSKLANSLVETREEIGTNNTLLTATPEEIKLYSEKAVNSMESLGEKYTVLNTISYSKPKAVLLSKAMSYANITGMFFPFTFESNVNIDVPFFTIPATMSHELAHQSGFMRENEANFIAYLSCKESENPIIRYSGEYLAFSYSISQLRAVDQESAKEIMSSLSETVVNDINNSSKYWSQHRGIVAKISRFLNDNYLKANNQSSGVKSYNQMVNLLLAEQRYEKGEK